MDKNADVYKKMPINIQFLPFRVYLLQLFKMIFYALIMGAMAVSFLMSFENFNTTLFLVGSQATLPINLYLQVRDGSTPVINAISVLMIGGTSLLALANLYFSKQER